jgi:hypothetical protein
MDPIDAFYQELDAQQLLDEHGPRLRDEARSILAEDPSMRIAGVIAQPDSKEGAALCALLSRMAGQELPERLVVGVVHRSWVESVLTSRVGDVAWKEEPWQEQSVLPVAVATRDGFKFGFFGLGVAEAS